MSDIVNAILDILKNPYLQKGYKKLAKIFQEEGRQNEADALKDLCNADNPHPDQK